MHPSNLPPFQAPGLVALISSVEMHTAGEPARIVWSGFPNLNGTLLQQLTQAKEKSDEFRRLLMLEPRGHYDMYGAILRPETDLVNARKADMGVLFMHNDGFSTMCGHATLALGRFLVDTFDETIFPRRCQLRFDISSAVTHLSLHIPCGIVEVSVPTLPSGSSDPSRPVSFVSVPSFATGIAIRIPLPEKFRWPELRGRTDVTVDFAYGGAFYCIIGAEELGFTKGLAEIHLQEMDHATKLLKEAITSNPNLSYAVQDIETGDQGFLSGVMITDTRLGQVHAAKDSAAWRAQQFASTEETGLCFFANQQVDRSPTGGCVAARVALAHAKGVLEVGERKVYNSLITRSYPGLAGFVGSVYETLTTGYVRVKVEGYGYYTAYHSFVVEKEDGLGVDGFSLQNIGPM